MENNTFPYLKLEQERQVILMKSLGINYPNNGYTFEQCVNTVLFMAGKNKFTLEELKEALRHGVNIGMQNVEQPRHEGDYNFNHKKAIRECEEYIQSLYK